MSRDFELPQMREAFGAFGHEYLPAITLVIVSKRINMKILHVVDRGGHENPPSGTVLDHTVTRRDRFDFFLVSQVVNQGTVMPTHYIVIEDECELGPEKLQKLTYRMTYMYYNWTGPVRVPAPCLVRAKNGAPK